MAASRSRFKNSSSLEDRLHLEATRLRSEADAASPGSIRDALLVKLEKVENAIRMNGWLTSPLSAPT